MNIFHNAFKKNQPTIISVIVFSILIFLTITYTKYKQGQWEKDIRGQLTEILIGKKSELEKALYSRIYYTRGVAAYVALNPEITTEEYHELAKEYIREDSVINSMAISRNAVISAIYPAEGLEQVIGLDLLAHPERKEIVQKTIETGLTFVAGPVELVEGGVAFISYTPIFDKTKTDNPFWGMTDIVIKKESLLNEANLNHLENGYRYALTGYNGKGEDGSVFWGEEQVFENNPVKININLPLGNWVLAAVPEKGWEQYRDQDKTLTHLLFASAFVISVLIWLFVNSLVKVKQNEKELKAIFASLDSLIIELNSKGEYINIASENEHLLALPKNRLIGKKLHDIFDEEKAGFFLQAITKCLQSKKLVII
ncbi:MAG: CHASE domain-containing protein, partial [Prolixibacteraceae bacterium]